MKRKLKIYFTDFWPVFNIYDNFFIDVLKDAYEVEVTAENPDFLFYSVFGINFHNYRCTRIFFTGENIRPNFEQCDWAFSFDFSDNPKNYRLPLYVFFADLNKLLLPKPPIEQLLKEKTKFCNFIYSNPSCKRRNIFFKKLSKYKKVDSAGRLYRNVDERVKNKIEFLKSYKFTIAFENESYPGYTTEKILEPMVVNSLPIYWGSPLVNRDFNPKSFLNYHEFGSDESLIEKIVEIDKNDDLLAKYLSEPYFEDNKLNKYVDLTLLKHRFDEIFNSDNTPIATKLHGFFFEEPFSIIRTKSLRAKFLLNHNLKKFKGISFQKIKIKIDKMKEQ